MALWAAVRSVCHSVICDSCAFVDVQEVQEKRCDNVLDYHFGEHRNVVRKVPNYYSRPGEKNSHDL